MFNDSIKKFNAFMECAKGIKTCFKNLTGLKICEYLFSHSFMTFIEYDNLHKKAYLFSERDYVNYNIKCSSRYEYYAVFPMVSYGYAVMTLIDLELNVNGLLKPKSVIDIVQTKICGV